MSLGILKEMLSLKVVPLGWRPRGATASMETNRLQVMNGFPVTALGNRHGSFKPAYRVLEVPRTRNGRADRAEPWMMVT